MHAARTRRGLGTDDVTCVRLRTEVSMASPSTSMATGVNPASSATRERIVGPAQLVEGPVSGVENWIRLGLGLVWMGACTILFVIILVLCLASRATRIRVGNLYGTCAGKGCAWLTGSRFSIRGEEHAHGKRPAIYIANHASIIDIFLGIWLSPTGTCGVGKKEVIWYPFFGQFFWLSGHLRIDRSNRASAVEALRGLATFVRAHGLSIFVWPEGTRSRDGRLKPFKKGPFHLALATGLPLVPMVIANSHKAWETRTLRLRRTHVDITFLDPIDTSSWTREHLDEHIQSVERLFASALPQDQRPS